MMTIFVTFYVPTLEAQRNWWKVQLMNNLLLLQKNNPVQNMRPTLFRWTFQLNNAFEWYSAVYRAKLPSEMCPTRTKIIRRSPHTIKVVYSLTSDSALRLQGRHHPVSAPTVITTGGIGTYIPILYSIYIYYNTYDSPRVRANPRDVQIPTMGQMYSLYIWFIGWFVFIVI